MLYALCVFQDYADRTGKGELNVLLPERPHKIGVSSGTTSGSSKMIPISKNSLKQFAMEVLVVECTCCFLSYIDCQFYFEFYLTKGVITPSFITSIYKMRLHPELKITVLLYRICPHIRHTFFLKIYTLKISLHLNISLR